MISNILFQRRSFISTLISTFSLLSIATVQASSKIPDFETTRLKSTAGAGVGSILMDEATILNPAPLSFFNVGALYFQKSGGDNTIEGTKDKTFDNGQTAFIASDSKGSLKGSLSYVSQSYQYDERKRFGASVAALVGAKSSFGMTYRYTKERNSDNGFSYSDQSYKQTVFGVTHFLSPNVTMGLVFIDPFKEVPEDTKGVIGMQYLYKDYLSVMLDAGADYNDNLNNTFLWKAALQAKFMSDFYVRVGTFNDAGKGEKGTGAGFGWVQPRLVFDLAVKNSDISENVEKNRIAETISETSFSISYRF